MNVHDTIHARLRISRWMAEEARATLDCVSAMGRGNRTESRACEAWALVCAERVKAWKAEAER
jgi:hypothetical protein